MSLVKAKGPIPKQLEHRRRVAKKGPYKWKKPPVPREDSDYMAAARGAGCVLSNKWAHECVAPMTFQHPQGLRYRGTSTKGPVKDGFGLCSGHHTVGPNSITEMGIRAWEKKYGPQEQHAAACRLRLGAK